MEFFKRFLGALKDLLTDSDNFYCIARSIGAVAAGAMTYKFLIMVTPDYLGYAGGIGAIIAAIAFKDLGERKTKPGDNHADNA